MNKQNIIIGAIAVIALILGSLTYFRPATTSNIFGAIPAVNAPAANSVLPNGVLLPNPSSLDYFVARLYEYVDGAIGFGNGTSVPTNVQAVRSSIVAATTTPCTTRNPFSSTSTISAALNITTATSSQGSIVIAVAATPNATTTVIGSAYNVASGAQTTLNSDGIASSTGVATVVGPSQYVTWGMTAGSGVSYNYTYGGTCTTVFTSVN